MVSSWQAVRQVQTLPRGALGLRDAAGSTLPDTGRCKSGRFCVWAAGPFLPDRGSWICGGTIVMEHRRWDERAGRRQLWNTGQRTVSFEETAQPEDASNSQTRFGGDSTSALWPPYSVKVNMVPAPNPTSSTCLPPVGNFSQRISLIRERRNVETGKQSRPNNDNVVITHSQGLLVLSQGL